MKRGSVAPTTAPEPLRPPSAAASCSAAASTRPAIRSCSGRPSASSRSRTSRAPSFEVRTEGEDAGARAGGGSEDRLERVGAHQRVRGDRVGAETRHVAPGCRRRAEQGVGVGLGGADVAALAVGDDEQPGVTGGGADLGERGGAARAERLEARELGLDRYAGRARRLDQPDAGFRRGEAAAAAASPSVPGRGDARAPGLGIGNRVEPDADLAPALFDQRREPVRERCRAAFRQVPAALDRGLEAGAGRELRHLAARDRDPLARARVDTLARTALVDAELPETGEVDVLAGLQGLDDGIQNCLDGVPGSLLAANALVLGYSIDEAQDFVTFASSWVVSGANLQNADRTNPRNDG